MPAPPQHIYCSTHLKYSIYHFFSNECFKIYWFAVAEVALKSGIFLVQPN